MTLLELQDVTYRYKNTAEAVLYQSSIILNPENFIASLGSLEQGNPLYCPFLLA